MFCLSYLATSGFYPSNPPNQQDMGTCPLLGRKRTLAQHMTILWEWRVSWACVDGSRKGNVEWLFVIMTVMTYMERSM